MLISQDPKFCSVELTVPTMSLPIMQHLQSKLTQEADSWVPSTEASAVHSSLSGDTGQPSEIPRTLPAMFVMSTEASPWNVPVPITRTSTRTWSEPMRRYTMPGWMVIIPAPNIWTMMGNVIALEKELVSGTRFARVMTTTWVFTPNTSSHRVVKLTRLTERTASAARSDGVNDRENICSLFSVVREGKAILFNLSFEDKEVDH